MESGPVTWVAQLLVDNVIISDILLKYISIEEKINEGTLNYKKIAFDSFKFKTNMSGIYIEKKVLKDFYEKIININKEDFLNSKFDDIILDIFKNSISPQVARILNSNPLK